MKKLLELKDAKLISKSKQKTISGGWPIVPQNCPGVFCPNGCHCNVSTLTCVFNAGTRKAGQFCYAL